MSPESNRRYVFPWLNLLSVICLVVVSVLPACGNTFSAFGPKTYARQAGAPVVVSDSFSVMDPAIRYSLRLTNSRTSSHNSRNEEDEEVSLVAVTLNGVKIVDPSQFGHRVSVIQVAVPLLASNKISVEVLGPVGGTITIEIIGGMLGTYTALGPKIYERSGGDDDVPITDGFSVAESSAHYVLRVTNSKLPTSKDGQDQKDRSKGNLRDSNNDRERSKNKNRNSDTDRNSDREREGDSDKETGVSSAAISINGLQVVSPRQFGNIVSTIEVPVSLQASNQIAVQVESGPGAKVTVEIVGAVGLFSVFGTKTYQRDAGALHSVVDSFSVLDPAAPFVLRVSNSHTGKAEDDDGEHHKNGGPHGEKDGEEGRGTSRAIISINGVRIFDGDDFHDVVSVIQIPVTLAASNQIGVEVSGKPGGTITAEILGLDTSPPVIAATITPAPNAAGWNNTNVVVSFTCSDTTSGIAVCAAPVAVGTEGAGQVITGAVINRAGNTATASVAINLDKTPPAVTASTSPAPNAAGWNNANVTVSFNCSDSLSGIANCPDPVQVITEGAGQIVTATATDKAGNPATTTIKLNIDKTPPIITASASPPPNANGWNNSNVTVTFQCSDSGSGIANCPAPQVVSTEGANQIITGSITDIAGNSASASVTLKIEKTPPSITASVTPPPNAAGWNNSDVTVSFQCGNSISGALSCPAPTTVTSEGASQLIVGSMTDAAGNTSQASVTINIDKTPPIITAVADPPPNASGWNNSNVTVSFHCSDSGSGVANCPAPQVVSTEGANQIITGSAIDIAGNAANASVTLKVDKTPPTVAITSPSPGTTLRISPTPLNGSVSDSLSGIASVTCNGSTAIVGAGGALNCASALAQGTNILTVSATDNAGNTASSQVSVTYVPPPIANAGTGYSGVPGVPITFSAAGSRNPANRPMAFTWDFGDGATGSDLTATHTFAKAGVYVVTLTVTDSSGATGTASTTALIVQPNLPPAASANGPYSGVTGRLIVFHGTASDPDGDPLTYTWDFGDGTTATSLSASHVYSLPNTYIAVLTVSDGQLSVTANATVVVTQANRPPTVNAGGPYSGVTGLAITLSATASDPDHDPLTITWDFGDGSNGSGATVSHAFALPGNYTITVTANDGRGGVTSATAAAAIAQANRPPHANPGGPYTGPAKTRIVFSGSASTDPDNDPLTYTWDFGDGASGTGVAPNHGYASEGTYTVTLTVDDGRGGKDSATVPVVITPAAAPANQPPVARPGGPYTGEAGQVVTFNGSASSDPDGDALTYSWDFGDGSTASGVAPVHIYASAGTYSVALTVDDGNGHPTTSATSATITPAADHVPPVISLSAPSKVLPGSNVTVTAVASDNVGVVSVTFDVDGAPSSTVTAPPYQRVISVPAVAAPGAAIAVRATAADAAGNTGVALAKLTIDGTPDTEKPTITLNAPANAAPGTVIRLSAVAADNVGVASVAFSTNGSPIATVPAAPYEAIYTVPSDAVVGSPIGFTARATDFTGNYADASAIVAIVQNADTTPPSVTLTVAPTVAPGGTLALAADASDDSGVASVSFYLEGVRIATLAQAPYSATFLVPPATTPGSILHIEARAEDFSNNEGRATAQTTVAAAEKAIALGQVLDDSTGLLLESATITLTGSNSSGNPYTETTQSDARGRYVIRAAAGSGVLHFTRDGMTGVDRPVSLQGGATVPVLDARMTPLAPPSAVVSGVLGGTVSGDAGSLTLVAGAISASPTFTLTTISQQGLQGRLPPGWSPVGAVDVAPHGSAIPGSTLSVRNPQQVAAGSVLVMAKWDEAAAAWRSTGDAAISADGTAIQGPVDSTGQYAVLFGDTQSAAPGHPNAGDLMTGVTASSVPADAVSLVTPKPKVIVYEPGVKSDVAGVFTSAAPLPSGTVISSRITESYHFFSGAEIHPDPYIADIVFYQLATDPSKQSAIYEVSPSITFEPLTLQSGVITVELDTPPAPAPPIATVGPNGGTATAPTGESIQVPPGSASDPIPVAITGLSATDLGISMPDGVDFVGAMRLNFTGTLALPATVSAPTPASLGDTTGILLVRLQELQGQTRLVLVGIGRVDGDHINSDVSLAGTNNTFEGVRVAGRYVFLHMQPLTAFAAGTVFGTDNAAFYGAMVSTPTLPIMSLSRGTNGYIAVAAVGAVTYTAMDLVRSDVGTGSLTLVNQNGVLALDLHLVAQPPSVASILPSDKSTSVSLDTAVVVTFSGPIDPASVSGTNAGNIALTAADGTVVVATLSLSSGNSVVTLRPSAPLQLNTVYSTTALTGVKNLSGYQLPAVVTATFTTLDTKPPPVPPAGSVTASIPVGGQTTVTATQGTAGAHDTVTIVNLNTGQVTPVLLNPDGGFQLAVSASATDQLQLRITGPAGNQTFFNLPRYSQTNPNGSFSAAVDSTGAHIDGPGGTAVDIPAGSLPDGSVVTMGQVAEADFPITLADGQKQLFTYSGGLSIDFGGATPAKYVNVSIPAGPNDTAADQWVVNQVVPVDGIQRLYAVDTARVINGRISTSSPPCPGVTGGGVYGIYKSKRQVGVAYGQLAPGLVVEVNAFGQFTGSLSDLVLLPWVSLATGLPINVPVCIPVLTGNVTVSANTVQISISSQNLTPEDRQIVIKDTTKNTEYHYPRDVVAYAFNVPGQADDHFKVTITKPDGTNQVLFGKFFDVVEASPGTVDVTLNADKINYPVVKVTIADQSVVPAIVNTFTDAAVNLKFDVAGAASDQYAVQAINSFSSTTPSRDVLFVMTPPAPPLDSGNLIAKAATGTIDPTRDEILAYNAAHPNLPPIDPSLGRNSVYIGDLDSGPDSRTPCALSVCFQVPNVMIVNGGFAFAFNGDETHHWKITVTYDNGRIDSQALPSFQLNVKNTVTGEILQTIPRQSPQRGRPVNLGTISGDTRPPQVISSPPQTNGFDPSAPLAVTFSMPMDPSTLQPSNFIVEENLPGQGWTPIKGTVQVSADGMSATFIPATGLQMGMQYRIRFSGVKSASGQELVNPTPIIFSTFRPNHVCPGGGASNTCPVSIIPPIDPLTRQPVQLVDVAFLKKADASGALKTTLVAISDTLQGANFLTYDVTNPTLPMQLAAVPSAGRKQRITLVPNTLFSVSAPIAPCAGGTPVSTFTGDLAVTSTFNTYYSFVSFWDITNPAKPCILGNKLLTASPDTLTDYSRNGTVHASGYARGVATLVYPNGLAAYVAVGAVGLMSADVGKNIPEQGPNDRKLEGLYPGDFQDVITVDNQLLAVEKGTHPPGALDLFDASLNELMTFALGDAPRCLVDAEGLGVDLNGDGIITPNEIRNVVFVGGEHSIQFIDVTDLTAPQVLGNIPMPGIVRSIDVDVAKHRLYAGVSTSGGGNLFVIDISNLQLSGAINNNGNPYGDDRILWAVSYPGIIGFRIDSSLGLAFVAGPGGLDLIVISDICCDLGVDQKQEEANGNTGAQDQEIADEKTAIKQGLANGFTTAVTACGIDSANADKVTILEQGSGACIWRGDCNSQNNPNPPNNSANPPAASSAPTGNYQPGISDHDFEVFIPSAEFDKPANKVPPGHEIAVPPERPRTPAQCLAAVLNDQFTEFDTGKPIKIMVNGKPIKFEDISFFPVRKEKFLAAQLDVEPPASAGSDPYGDLGLGRQQLLLKWLLEGEYIRVPLPNQKVLAPGPDELQAGILSIMQSGTGIPPLEGLEWAVLQEFNLTKSLGFIRIQGADQDQSPFHDLFEKQVHDAGKAGVRAALAQMIAVPSGNNRILNISRAEYGTGACVEPAVANPLPGRTSDWVRDDANGNLALTKCYSFEEYVASQAVRDADDAARAGTTSVFTPDQAQQVYRFFRVKANQVPGTVDDGIFNSEIKAEDFIASVARFISTSPDGVKAALDAIQNASGSVCGTNQAPAGAAQSGVQNDPRTLQAYYNGMCALSSSNPQQFLQRLKNLQHARDAIDNDKLVHGTIAATRAKNAGVRAFNDGSAPAKGVYVRMFRMLPPGAAGGQSLPVESVKTPVTLPGGHRPGFEQWVDFTVGSFLTSPNPPAPNTNPPPPQEDPSNPFINQGTADGNAYPVTFVIDLPERSVKEADRQNNWNGFYYWVLDRTVPNHTIPSSVTPGKPPFPLFRVLLEPDIACIGGPKLTIMQTVNNDKVHILVTNDTDTTVTNVIVCSDITQPRCSTPFDVPAHSQVSRDLTIYHPPNAATVVTTATALGMDSSGYTVPIAASQVEATIESPIQVAFFDATPLSALDHPFSRYTRSYNTLGDEVPIQGAVTDGTVNAVRIALSGLQPNLPATVALVDPDPSITDGLGLLVTNQGEGRSVTITADLLGKAVVAYTPPSFFLRPSAQQSDWDKGAERAVNVVVHQENVGTTTQPLRLRRPPVFLVHGLFGKVDAFDQFQPFVPAQPPAQPYVLRPGFDGRFDLFSVGSVDTSRPLAVEVGEVRGDIKTILNSYLPGFAIGKIDILGHSMGGLIARKMTSDNPVIAQAVRKLIIINSPLRGTPVADKVVQTRDDWTVNIKSFDKLLIDFLNPSSTALSDPSISNFFKLNLCYALIAGGGAFPAFNVHNGAVDDLQTTATVIYNNSVPTHHIVTTMDYPYMGASFEVTLMWRALGYFCKWTPDSSTVENTTAFNATAEIVKTIAGAASGLLKAGGLQTGPYPTTNISFNNLTLVPELSMAVQKGLYKGLKSGISLQKFLDKVPTPVFSSPANDRLVPATSALEGLTFNDQTVTQVLGYADHQSTKISSGIPLSDCVVYNVNGIIVSSPIGVPQFRTSVGGGIEYQNPDPLNPFSTVIQKPPAACHVMNLLEADPQGAYFKQP